ncbi:hypothetical protein R3P38DRAFT_3198595 [Favolaschia claudopus]|uniref:Uncharacterized protein n=1 Tax=Favolaschia claudopus TaxID=2862362 RepID=A0AAW0B2A4_9AGAR
MEGETGVENGGQTMEESEITEIKNMIDTNVTLTNVHEMQASVDTNVALTYPPPRPIREMRAGARQDVLEAFPPPLSPPIRSNDLEPRFLTGPDEPHERQNPLEFEPFLNPAQRAEVNRAHPIPADPFEAIAEFHGALQDFLVPRTNPLERAEVALDQLLDHGELTEEEHAALYDTNDIDEAERAWERLRACLEALCNARDRRLGIQRGRA